MKALKTEKLHKEKNIFNGKFFANSFYVSGLDT